MNVYLIGDVGYDFTAEQIAKKINGQDSVTAYIDSYGGIAEEGLKLYQLFSQVPDMTTIAVNRVYSAALFPFLAGKTRIAEQGAKFLIHATSVQDRITAETAIMYAELLIETDAQILDFLTSKTGIDPSKLAAMMQKDTFLNAEMAKKTGIVTEIKQKPILNKIENMSTFKETLQKIKNSLGMKQPNNMLIGLEGGGAVYVYTEDEILEGKNVVLANENGEPTDTPAPDGEHTLADGRVITVADGVITSTAEAKMDEPENGDKIKDEEMAALAETVAKLSEKYTQLEASYNEQQKKNKEYESLAEVVAEVAAKIQTTYTPQPRAAVLNNRANFQTVNGKEEAPQIKIMKRKN